VFWAGVVIEKAMGSVPGKQRPNSFVETVQVQSAPMENSPTRHGMSVTGLYKWRLIQ